MKNLIIVILTFLIVSCHHIEKGHISEKEYEPSRMYTVLMPMRIGKITTLIPYMIYDNEDYILTIESEENGKLIHENIYVTKDYYNSLNIGDQWCRTPNCAYSDKNNTKTRN